MDMSFGGRGGGGGNSQPSTVYHLFLKMSPLRPGYKAGTSAVC